jgi:hypothetical protein
VDSFDLHPSNQYILVRVIPSCFRFVNMYLRHVSKSLVQVQLEILGIFWRMLYVVHMDWGGGMFLFV